MSKKEITTVNNIVTQFPRSDSKREVRALLAQARKPRDPIAAWMRLSSETRAELIGWLLDDARDFAEFRKVDLRAIAVLLYVEREAKKGSRRVAKTSP